MSESFRPNDNHWRMAPGLYSERITKQQARDLLLNYPDPIVMGRLCKWTIKHLGVGVYELRIEEGGALSDTLKRIAK